MQKKLDKFDIKDIHSGYVVKFRNGKLALCMRVGEKFTKIFACVDEDSIMRGSIDGKTFFYTSSYKSNHYIDYDCCRGVPCHVSDFDVVEVYGLIEGTRNYLNVGDTGPISIKNRPLLWSEVKKMTLKDIEKELGYKVEIVGEGPIKDDELCSRCKYSGLRCGYSNPRACPNCAMFDGDLIGKHCVPCKCKTIKDGEPCPYFKEA